MVRPPAPPVRARPLRTPARVRPRDAPAVPSRNLPQGWIEKKDPPKGDPFIDSEGGYEGEGETHEGQIGLLHHMFVR